MAKKGARILTGMRCTKCGTQGYVTLRNKLNTPKLSLKKYCKVCRAHVEHASKDKLK